MATITKVKKVKSRTVKTTYNYEDMKHIIENRNITLVSYSQGALLDNYIFTHENGFKIERKNFEYIILCEKYMNEWSSCFECIFTNDLSIVTKYYDMFENWNDEEDQNNE